MNGLGRTVLAGLAAIIAAAPALPAAQREMRERHVLVGATRDTQVPVTDLVPADFTVREDGVAREVLRVEAAPPPSHIALLVDDSGVSQPLVSDLRAGFTSFVRGMTGLSPEPLMALSTFGERPTPVVAYAIDPAMVLSGIGRLFSRPGSGAHLLDAIVDETGRLRKLQAPRPVIVAFVAEEGPEFSTGTNKRVADALKEAGASLWTVTLQARNPDTSSSEARERAAVLTDVARASGGDSRSILSRQAIEPTLVRIAAQLLSRYDVVYSRPDALIPPSRLQVEVKRGGVRLTAPTWTGR